MEVNTGDMSLYDSIDAFTMMDMDEDVDKNIKISDSNTNKSIAENMVADSETDVNMKKSEPCNADDIDVNIKVYDAIAKDLGNNDSNSSLNNKIENEVVKESVPEININEEGSNKETRDLGENIDSNGDGTKSDKEEDTGQSSEGDESSRESNSRQDNPDSIPVAISFSCTNGDIDDKSNEFDDVLQKESITQETSTIFNRITDKDKVVREFEEEMHENNVNVCEVCQKWKEEVKKDTEIGEKVLAEGKEIGIKCKCRDIEKLNTIFNEPEKSQSEEDKKKRFQERTEEDDSKSAGNPDLSKTKMKVCTTDDETRKKDNEQKNGDLKIKTNVKDDTSDDDMKKEDKPSKEEYESSKEDDKSSREDDDSSKDDRSSRGDDDDDDDVVELPQPPLKCISVDSDDSQGHREGSTENPVFVEIGVETILAPSPPDSPTDCMMLVENVQVDVDPSSLMMNDDYDPSDDDDAVKVEVVPKPQDPVSLLTSSDEDDVILQEPHIDTVDVSDETDEDDVPLTRLAKELTPRSKGASSKQLTDIFWGKSNEVYCYLCKFVTRQRSALALHMAEHRAMSQKEIEVQCCTHCNFQSPSKIQFTRHMAKHKDEKTFRCAFCVYRAKHKMSLVYHMKSHREAATYKCQRCPFRATAKSLIQKHLKVHKAGGLLECTHCDFTHRSSRMLKLHVHRKHKGKSPKTKTTKTKTKTTRKRPRDDDEDDDDEYVPGMKM